MASSFCFGSFFHPFPSWIGTAPVHFSPWLISNVPCLWQFPYPSSIFSFFFFRLDPYSVPSWPPARSRLRPSRPVRGIGSGSFEPHKSPPGPFLCPHLKIRSYSPLYLGDPLLPFRGPKETPTPSPSFFLNAVHAGSSPDVDSPPILYVFVFF